MISELARDELKESLGSEGKVEKESGKINSRVFLIGRALGKGDFQRGYEFFDLDNKQISAAKVIRKESLMKAGARSKVLNQVQILRDLSHQNIVKFKDFFEDFENFYIILELCKNQTLRELIGRRKRLMEIEVRCYVFQVISALKYLHSHRVIHRDIKLGNLFLTDKMELKLGGFELATKLKFDGEKIRTICGTNYMAPEILDGSSGYSYEVDIWSLGIVIYTMLVGKSPFETNDVKLTYKRIKMNAYSFPDQINISQEAKKIISEILVNDPKARPTLDDLLSHPFLTKSPFPRLLPASTLVVPPFRDYLVQSEPAQEEVKTNQLPRSASQSALRRTLDL